MAVEAVDLFCGVGGLTHGVRQSGIEVLAGIDIDSTCEFPYTQNNQALFIGKSVEEVSGDEIKNLYSDGAVKVLLGCAPCQPFSRYSDRYNKEGFKDNKWKLLYEFERLIRTVKPDVISMENVPKLRNTDVFKDFLITLENEGYSVYWRVVNCAEYGVAQNRKRLVLLASKFGEINLIGAIHDRENFLTVRDTIAELDRISDGTCSARDQMHRASKLSKINKERIRQSIPGGTWEDWDPKLLLKCHKKKTGKTYKSVYGRMEWDRPAPTMTTQFFGFGNGRFGHPEQDRAISLREGALLQSFPVTYEFYEEGNMPTYREIATHIGNAVPVRLGQAIGDSIINHLREVGMYNDRE